MMLLKLYMLWRFWTDLRCIVQEKTTYHLNTQNSKLRPCCNLTWLTYISTLQGWPRHNYDFEEEMKSYLHEVVLGTTYTRLWEKPFKHFFKKNLDTPMQVANIHRTNNHTNYLVLTQFIFSPATIRTGGQEWFTPRPITNRAFLLFGFTELLLHFKWISTIYFWRGRAGDGVSICVNTDG